jgi:hypothetical protein
MPKYNVRLHNKPGFKDCIWANDQRQALDRFFDAYRLDKSQTFIMTVQEIFEIKNNFSEVE